MPASHQFIGIASGRLDPDDRTRFCYKVFCECGWLDFADTYGSGDALRKEHRVEMGDVREIRKGWVKPKPRKLSKSKKVVKKNVRKVIY